MNFFVVVIFAIACFALPRTATAAPNKDAVACDSPVPSIRVAGCTRLLHQKSLPLKFLWLVYLQRGAGYADQGEFDRALADFDIAVQKNPKSAAAYSNRGNAHSGLGHHDLAIHDADKAIQLDPTFAHAYATRGRSFMEKGDHDKAVADLDKAIRLDPKPRAPYYVNRSSARNGLGHHDLAIQDAEKAIQIDPAFALAYAARGNSLLQRGDYDKAIADLDKAIGLDPKLQGAYNNRSIAWEAKGELDRALADSDAAVRIDPRVPTSYENRCSILDAKEQFDAAIADCNRALALAPQSIVALGNRGGALFRKGDLDRALADYDQLIQNDPEAAGAYIGRAEVRRARGDTVLALADLDRAIRLNPRVAGAYANRGLLHEAAGDTDKARSDYETAIALPAEVTVSSRRGNYSQESRRERGIAKTRLALLRESAVAPPNPPPPPTSKGASSSPAADHGRRIALVIGNGAYTGAPALANPANDARLIAKNLRDLGFEVTEGNDLKHAEMKRTIHDFLRGAANAKMTMVFYAGHGMQIDGKNYLVPVDADLSKDIDITADMTDVDFILTGLDDKIRTNIIVLDACRDNPLAQMPAKVPGTGRTITLRSGLATPSGLGAGATLGAGTLLAFATAPGQVALDGDGANSPFSAALGRHISTPGIEVQQMLTRVRSEVVSATRNRQVPWSNSSLLGEVYLVGDKAR
jgi:tetratricopeptide (TPR) repeat protein